MNRGHEPSGARPIVSKPYAAADLLALVNQFIGRRHEDRRIAASPWTGADRRGHLRPSYSPRRSLG